MADIIKFPTDYKPQTQKINRQQMQETPMVVNMYSDGIVRPNADVFVSASLSDKLKTEASKLYEKALCDQIEVSKLIFKTAAKNFEDDVVDDKEIIFSENRIGRLVMTEYNQKGKKTRETTFDRQDGKITRIETIPNEAVVFFDWGCNHTEITRVTKHGILGKTEKEVFVYEYGRPLSYNKYENPLLKKEEVLIQSCYFRK